ncbi:MAG TPA: hypothetical protein VGF14_00505 [Alphaproteobacteria bacterium]
MQEDYGGAASGDDLPTEQKNFLADLRRKNAHEINDGKTCEDLRHLLGKIINSEDKYNFLRSFKETAYSGPKTVYFLANQFFALGYNFTSHGNSELAVNAYSACMQLCTKGSDLHETAITCLDDLVDRNILERDIALKASRNIIIQTEDPFLIEKHTEAWQKSHNALEDDEKRYEHFNKTLQKHIYPDHFVRMADNALCALINNNPGHSRNRESIGNLIKSIKPQSKREAYWCQLYHHITFQRDLWEGDAYIYKNVAENYPLSLNPGDAEWMTDPDNPEDALEEQEYKYDSYSAMMLDIYDSLARFKSLHDHGNRNPDQIAAREHKIRIQAARIAQQKPSRRIMSMLRYNDMARDFCRADETDKENNAARVMKNVIENWFLPGPHAPEKGKLEPEAINATLEKRTDIISLFTHPDYQSDAVSAFARDKLVIYKLLQESHYDDTSLDLNDEFAKSADLKVSSRGPLHRYRKDPVPVNYLSILN